jgi:hypothetical protein
MSISGDGIGSPASSAGCFDISTGVPSGNYSRRRTKRSTPKLRNAHFDEFAAHARITTLNGVVNPLRKQRFLPVASNCHNRVVA